MHYIHAYLMKLILHMISIDLSSAEREGGGRRERESIFSNNLMLFHP